MSEQLTTNVFELDNDKYLLKKGSYIPMRKSNTIKGQQDKLVEKGILEPGVNFNDKTGEIFEDIIFPNKTSLAGILFGSNAYKRQQTTGTIEGVIDIQYYDSEGHVIDTHTNQNNTDNKGKSKHINQDTENIKLKGILSYLNMDIKSTKKEKVELLCLWACKKGYPYNDVRKIIINYDADENTIKDVREKVRGDGSVSEEGITDEKSSHKFKNWPMNITKKGERKYEELVKKLILPDKQEQYLNLGKERYEDELKLDSVLGYINRMIYHEDIEPEERLGRLPQHNRDFLMGVLAYYQVGMGEHNFKDDLTQALNEVYSKDIFKALEQDIRYCLSVSEDLLQADSTSDEHKKNVNALTRMLGLVEEMVFCNISEKK